MTVLDWSFSRPDLTKVREVATGVVRYLPSPGHAGKGLTPAERDAILDAGLDLGLVWQRGTGEATGANDGNILDQHADGAADRTAAEALADQLGAPATTAIYLACDTNPKGANRQPVIDYYRGARSAARRPCGAYVGDDPGVFLLDEGTIDYLWQPGAKSWSVTYPHPRAALVQRVGMPWDLGGAYDYNDVGHPWGGWTSGTVLGQTIDNEEDDTMIGLYVAGEGWFLWAPPVTLFAIPQVVFEREVAAGRLRHLRLDKGDGAWEAIVASAEEHWLRADLTVTVPPSEQIEGRSVRRMFAALSKTRFHRG